MVQILAYRCPARIHYRNQCWVNFDAYLHYKWGTCVEIEGNCNGNSIIFIHEKDFENVSHFVGLNVLTVNVTGTSILLPRYLSN